MLKIDLLPRHFAIARTNKRLVALFIVLLILFGGGWFVQASSISKRVEETKAKTEALQPKIQEVDRLTQETQEKQSQMAPLKARVDFARDADASGRGYWEAFWAINEYIWEEAQLTQFQITPPASVSFTVKVKGTLAAGRFLMNILRCPAITNITMSGLPGGGTVAGGGGAMPMPGAPPGAPPPPGAAPPPPPAPGAGGAPGAPPPPPSMPGTPGMPGAPAGGAVGTAEEVLTLTVSAQLTPQYQITVPQPPGAGGPAAAGPGAMPGMPEMPGGPGAGPPAPPTAPPAPKAGAKGEEEGAGAGGGLRKGGKVGEDV